LNKVATDTSKSLYGRNKDVYPNSLKTAAQRALYNKLTGRGAGAGGGRSDSGCAHGRLARQHHEDQEDETGDPHRSHANKRRVAYKEQNHKPLFLLEHLIRARVWEASRFINDGK